MTHARLLPLGLAGHRCSWAGSQQANLARGSKGKGRPVVLGTLLCASPCAGRLARARAHTLLARRLRVCLQTS